MIMDTWTVISMGERGPKAAILVHDRGDAVEIMEVLQNRGHDRVMLMKTRPPSETELETYIHGLRTSMYSREGKLS